MGVQSSRDFTFKPADCNAVMALSRPEPGPFTRTSMSLTPNLIAFSAACCAAHWPANGVLFLDPLNPDVPALAQHNVSPRVSVMVTEVLLNVALMCAIPTVTLRLTFRFFVFDIYFFACSFQYLISHHMRVISADPIADP
jgi:hypothetical protein